MGGFLNWMFESLASEDVIDLYFVLRDLLDIEISPRGTAANFSGR